MATSEALQDARASQERRAWVEAYEAFSRADHEMPLGASDLEAWSASAYLLGRQNDYQQLLDRAHQAYLDRGDRVRAAHCACWLGLSLAGVGASAQASGWFARAKRLLNHVAEETVVHGYLELAMAFSELAAGRLEEALDAGNLAVESGVRFDDPDLTALALQFTGRLQLRLARITEGFALLDEAMLVVASGALRPQAAGIVYCSVIDGCRDSYSLHRAHEWTLALTQWCAAQPDLITFTGECRVARAEMLVLRGAWHDALAEAERACEQAPQWSQHRIMAAAAYQRAEVARLRGDFEVAEQQYAAAAQSGGRTQPGLGLLRLTQGQVEAAEHGLNRALDETADPLRRARLLPARVVVALAGSAAAPDKIELARAAAEELARIAEAYGDPGQNPVLETMAHHASGAVTLALGDTAAASQHLRAAADGWRELAAPYETAKVRVLLGATFRLLGDADAAAQEFAAAREEFTKLGAEPDLAQLTAVADDPDSTPFAAQATQQATRSRLSARELEVLGGLVAGNTNRAIAEDLDISERTVDRHVSNIFDKLGVSSRTEAATYALKRGLL